MEIWPCESWFDILTCDGAEEDVLSYHFLFYFLYSRVSPEHLLIENLFLVLMSEEFSVEWILSISQRCLIEKLGFEGNLAAKMIKELAQDLQISMVVTSPWTIVISLDFGVLMIGLQHYI